MHADRPCALPQMTQWRNFPASYHHADEVLHDSCLVAGRRSAGLPARGRRVRCHGRRRAVSAYRCCRRRRSGEARAERHKPAPQPGERRSHTLAAAAVAGFGTRRAAGVSARSEHGHRRARRRRTHAFAAVVDGNNTPGHPINNPFSFGAGAAPLAPMATAHIRGPQDHWRVATAMSEPIRIGGGGAEH